MQPVKLLLTLICAALLTGLTATSAQEYSEAPQLAERVEAGELPPIAERLPASPLVVEPLEQIGTYGGTWRMALTGSGDRAWLARTIGYDYLLRYDVEGQEVAPNLVESWEVSDDARVYTLTLREGLRWSDGEPFTTADLMFYYEDVLQNEDLVTSPPGYLTTGGELATFEAVDETTLRVSFTEPNGVFIEFVASTEADDMVNYPRHYAEQFHADYNDNIDALVAEAGLSTWVDLFEQRVNGRNANWQNLDKPTLNAWVLTAPYDGSSPLVTFERNPYYFKVDTEGNQLPYIDNVRFQVTQEREVTLLQAIGGEIDFQWRRINSPSQRPVLAENAERGNYTFHERVPTNMNEAVVFFNLTTSDPVKREIFNNKDFRIGVSHAIDRQEIINLVYSGLGEPWQAAPREESRFFDEEFATQFVEFDVDLANEALDRAGYSERNANGIRLGPDGNPITFTLEVADGKSFVDAAPLIAENLRAVGLNAQARIIERSFFEERASTGEIDAGLWDGEGGVLVIFDPRWYIPFNDESYWSTAWAAWYNSGGAQGEEPPAAVQEQLRLYDQVLATADADERAELVNQMLDIAQEEFWTMGISLAAPSFGITKNNMVNTPDTFSANNLYFDPGQTNPPQYAFVDGRNDAE